jgi:single-stranded-DNA-specific exonuclease
LLIPEIVVDAEISFSDVRRPFYDILCQMEPFGPENLRPVFICRKVYNTGYSKIVKDAHLRFSLKQDEFILTGIGFNMANKMPLLEANKPLDVVFKIDENEWNGEKILQLKIIDLKLSD